MRVLRIIIKAQYCFLPMNQAQHTMEKSLNFSTQQSG